tara:strand:+ start:3687 stop:4376 length:690 start_codon:yes stop_codon:yes gene_type:complete
LTDRVWHGKLAFDLVRAPTVVFEDEDLLILDKPQGVLVEGFNSGEGTLADWVKDYLGNHSRPLHRLDRDTSGLVLFAKNQKWNRKLSELFDKKKIRKEYWTIVVGSWDKRTNKVETKIRPLSEGRWENSVDIGKPSKTTFRVLGSDSEYSWIQALPKTGRTHQIRLHCLEAGHPIVGDRFYSSDRTNALMLHAHSLGFRHPNGSGDVRVSVDPPEFWHHWLNRLSFKAN